ncbi:hypothetical protein AVEN_91411-1 [Araneus ventricosus]|uniref:Uncharacterized protein n=1 Tax=Araneus ventricosus TaxID=182803 RepID=A0A4Y2QTP8_ARAVE|nr:hypothetical protein AVEN_91411-1 [Araneus ventricosus]
MIIKEIPLSGSLLEHLPYVIHHRLAILLDTRETDVLKLELDKPKKKPSSRASLGKTLPAIRGTDVDPQRSPLKQLSREQGMY